MSRTPGRTALGYIAVCLAGMVALCWLIVVFAPDRQGNPPQQHKLTAITAGEAVQVGTSVQDGPKLIVAPVRLANGRSSWLQVTKPVKPGTHISYWQRQDTGAILTQPFLGDYWHHDRIWLWLALPLVLLCGYSQFKANGAADAWRRQRHQRPTKHPVAHQM